MGRNIKKHQTSETLWIGCLLWFGGRFAWLGLFFVDGGSLLRARFDRGAINDSHSGAHIGLEMLLWWLRGGGAGTKLLLFWGLADSVGFTLLGRTRGEVSGFAGCSRRGC